VMDEGRDEEGKKSYDELCYYRKTPPFMHTNKGGV